MQGKARNPQWCLTLFSMLLVLLFTEVWSADPENMMPSPPTTFEAVRGLSQTVSAEPLGMGRLTFSLLGTWYQQETGYSGTPAEDADVSTGLLAFSYGVSSYVDVFGRIAGYGIFNPEPLETDIGVGSVAGGIQGSLPLPSYSPLRLGAQLSIIGGTSTNQLDVNNADGYNYFETRTGYDFVGKLMQTLAFGTESRGIKFHFNEGGVMSLQDDHDMLLLLGGGVQGSVHPMVVLGLEAHSRTHFKNIAVQADPLWVTPSIQLRTPYFFSATLGSDISVSDDPVGSKPRVLEPFRIFGGLAFSFDLMADKRAAEAEKIRQDAAEKQRMAKSVTTSQQRADSIARKAKEDSVANANARDAERMRADSLATSAAAKARQDSIVLAETRKKLDEERSKRSDAEKQLLSTGLLLLDACYFETGKAEISINSYPYLNIIGKMLTKYPKLQIEIGGHTDNVGKMTSNMLLSQSRAEAVRLYLIQVAPELSSNLTARGYGPTQPKASNVLADGRKMNRRVELQVMNKDVLKEYNP